MKPQPVRSLLRFLAIELDFAIGSGAIFALMLVVLVALQWA